MGLAEGHRSQLGAWLGGHFAGPVPLNAAIVLPSIASTMVSGHGFRNLSQYWISALPRITDSSRTSRHEPTRELQRALRAVDLLNVSRRCMTFTASPLGVVLAV